VKHWDAHLGDHTANDGRLSERAVPGLANRKEEALEEGCRLVECLLDSHVEVVVDLLGLAEVIPHPRQQHKIEESEEKRKGKGLSNHITNFNASGTKERQQTFAPS